MIKQCFRTRGRPALENGPEQPGITSNGDGRERCPRGPEDRGGHGPSRVGGGSPCAERDLLVMPGNAAVHRLRTEGPHAEGQEFRPGAFPELTTPMDLPGGHWLDFRRHWLEM